MKIIITEQQFNLILLGEGKGDKQYTPEEVEISEENYENLSPKLLLKYNDYVKQFEEYYTNTGKLMKVGEGKKNGEWYSFLRWHGLIPKFYKDVKRDEKIEEIKKQTYIDIVDYYNNLYKRSGITITPEYNPDYVWLGKKNSKPLEKNPDYVWLQKNKKLDDFYDATNHTQRVKEMGGRYRNYLIKTYGFIPQEATAQQVLDYITKKGYTSWIEFKSTNFYNNIQLIRRDVYNALPTSFKRESLGERYIKEWLNSEKITGFERQYTFCDLKDIGCLLMDFYSPNFNNYQICIEFDGRQHFQKVSFSNKDTDEILEERLNNIKKRDTIKNQYCYNNGIKLYRIKHDSPSRVSKSVIDKIMEVIKNDIESGKFEHEFNKKGYIDTQNIPNDKETEI